MFNNSMQFAKSIFNMLIICFGFYLTTTEVSFLSVVVILSGIWLEARVVITDVGEQKIRLVEARADFTSKVTKFGMMLSTLDTERWNALGIEFPELEIVFDGRPRVRLAGSNLLLPCLQKFLMDSNKQEFVPENYYNDDWTLQTHLEMSREAVRKQWWIAARYLQEKGFLTKEPSGPHTWVWADANTLNTLQGWFIYSKPFEYPEVLLPDQQILKRVPVNR